MAEFRMPSLGADMESGTLVEWLVKPGSKVSRGDLVAVVETQKGAIDVEIFDSGVITEILVNEGEEVPVGTPLAILNGRAVESTARSTAAPTLPMTEAGPESQTPTATVTKAPQPSSERGREGRIRVSPVARQLASDEGIDLADVPGTGPGGAITLLDVQRAVTAAPTAIARPEDRLAEMRKAIAAAMTRSKREIPHYYLGHDIDMSRALHWIEQVNLGRPVSERLVYASMLLKAVAIAVREVPEMNGFWIDERFDQRQAVHVGVAIALRGGGLVAPAIHDTDQKSLDEIMAALRDLVRRSRTGRLRSSEVSEPTITVTNLGDQSVKQVFGIIYPPQVALVGFGSIVERPRVENGEIAVRPIISASLSADHRASVGHRGAQFLLAIERSLQEPEKL